jgi:hypothetical protein
MTATSDQIAAFDAQVNSALLCHVSTVARYHSYMQWLHGLSALQSFTENEEYMIAFEQAVGMERDKALKRWLRSGREEEERGVPLWLQGGRKLGGEVDVAWEIRLFGISEDGRCF